MKKIRYANEYGMCWQKTGKDVKVLKACGVRGNQVEYERRQKQHILDDDGENKNQYAELFRDEMALKVSEEFLRIRARSRDGARMGEATVLRLSPVHARVPTVVRCLTKREETGGQRQNLYAKKQGNVLKLAIQQLIEYASVFVQHSMGDEVIHGLLGVIGHVVDVPLTNERYLCADRK